MTQLEVPADLYEQIAAQANKAGQSVQQWLFHQVDSAGGDEIDQFYTWFARLVAHDLRTPLAGIMTSADILRYYQHRLTEERRLEHLDTIQMQVRVLNNLLDNIMVIQKTIIGTLVYQPLLQDLEAAGREAVETVLAMMYQQPTVQVHAAENMRPVLFDEKLLNLALVNLLVNAIRYSPNETPVHIHFSATPTQATVQVRDEGIGIPVDEQAQVLDLFYRASNAQNIIGHGLGLPVVQRIVSIHGGSLHLESVPQQGTTVTITLPLG